MAYDLCQVQEAQEPYYIENIGTGIYSIEELCFYLYENVYLIDDTIMNEQLCDWIRDQLGLTRLYRQLYEHLEKQDGIASFILPIFREIGYLDSKHMREFQETLARLEVQPADARQKLKGDSLMRSGMYGSAISEYYQILERQGPGALSASFYAQVWNNLGCAYAHMFRFPQAANCFLKSWKQSKTKETLRRYISVLPLYLSDEQYEKRLGQLGADEDLMDMIRKYNLKAAQKAADASRQRGDDGESPHQQLERIKAQYRRSTK